MLGVGMATTAGLRQPQRIDWRFRVPGFADIVYAVAIDAGRHGLVANRQPPAMHARPVLRELVDPLLRLEPVDHCRVTVAARAEFRNLRPARLADESPRRIHRDLEIVRIWVAAVAIVTSKSTMSV